MKLFLSPHNDDETLFGSFTILREKPIVAIVFDSVIQVNRGNAECSKDRRRQETLDAMNILKPARVDFLGFSDAIDVSLVKHRISNAMLQFGRPEMVYAPAVEMGGHSQHNLIGELTDKLFPCVTHYMTYTRFGKSVGKPVDFEPSWPALKLKALSCYETQLALPSTREHFLREQFEYYALG